MESETTRLNKFPETHDVVGFDIPADDEPFLGLDGQVMSAREFCKPKTPRYILRRKAPNPCTPDEQELKIKFLTEQVVALEGKNKDLTSQRDALRDIQRTSDHQRLEMDQILSKLNRRNDELQKQLASSQALVQEYAAAGVSLRAKLEQSLLDHAALNDGLQSETRMRAAAEERCDELHKHRQVLEKKLSSLDAENDLLRKKNAKTYLDFHAATEKNEAHCLNLNAFAEAVAKLNALVEQYNGPSPVQAAKASFYERYLICPCNGAGCDKCNSQGRG